MRKLNSVLIGISLLLLICIVVLYLNDKQTSNTNENLEKKNSQLEEDVEKIQIQRNQNSKVIQFLLKDRDSLIQISKSLTKEVKITKSNLKLITGKYKNISADSSYIILKYKYEMDSIANIKH